MRQTGKHECGTAETGGATVFPVEVCLREKKNLAPTMEKMRTWLDHRHVEPVIFRYAFSPNGIRLQVDFAIKSEADAFCHAFDGKLLLV